MSLGFDNGSHYVDSYLPYLLHTWLESDTGSMLEFPWQLLGSESQTAFLRYFTSLVLIKLCDI